jgi:outer membrane protein TolC
MTRSKSVLIAPSRRSRPVGIRHGEWLSWWRLVAVTSLLIPVLSGLAAAQVPPAPQSPRPAPAGQTINQTIKLTLDEAVLRAVDHNPDLAVVRLGIDAEASRVGGSRSAFAPVLTSAFGRSSIAVPPTTALLGTDAVQTGEWFGSAGLRQRLPKGGGSWSVTWDGSRTSTDSPFSSFDPSLQSGVLLAFSQPLLKDRETDAARHQYVIAQRNLASSELRFRESLVQTVAAVKQAYWTLKAARANLTVQQRSLELAEDLVRVNRARVEIGQAPPIDLVQAQAEAAQRREGLIQADAAARDAEDALRRLIMDPADAAFWAVGLDPVSEPIDAAPAPDVAQAIAGAMQDRYDLARARQDLDIAVTNVSFFRNQTLPDVRFEASYRTGGAGGTQILRSGPFPGEITGVARRNFGDVLGQLFTHEYPTWSVGVTASYPIGQSYDEANHARAEIERRQAAHRIASLELQVAETVRRAARQVQSTAERIEAARAGETLAVERLDVERKRFDAGLSTTFLVTQAQRDLLQAQVNRLQATLDHQSAVVNFEAVQLAAPSAAGATMALRGAEVVAIPTPQPRGIFRPGGGQ